MDIKEVFEKVKSGKMSLAEFTAYVVDCEEYARECGYYAGYDAAAMEYSS